MIYDSTMEGNYSQSIGGGVILGNGSMVFSNCTVISNIAALGAGVNCNQYGHNGVTMLWCRITGNMQTNGGHGAGIRANGDLVLDHCIIDKNVSTNSTYTFGAGLYLALGATNPKKPRATVRNCVFACNSAGGTGARGAGIWIEGGSTNSFSACTIAGNLSMARGGGIYLDSAGSNTFTNCVISSNILAVSAADNNIYMTTSLQTNSFYYCCSERLTNTAQGNITAGPVFMDVASGNYRLGRGSPCINAGTNESWMINGVDLDSRARIRYNAADMGAYEHIYEAMIFRGW